jgi:CheY-like chemotaxis protein/CheY-specific phosphatase CheX
MEIAISEENLKLFVDDAVITVFELVLNMHIERSQPKESDDTKEGQVIGMVGIAGRNRGVVCLRVEEGFSRIVARAMLSMEADDALSVADVNDVVGELTNIIAGKIKYCLRSDRETCVLSLPTIVRGDSIDLESISGVERRFFSFRYASHNVTVELYSVNEQGAENMSTPKILLIDDSKATRSVLAKMFTPYHCEVIEAPNGAIGLQMALMHQPALIILDMTMPVMNGMEALDRLKADVTTQNIPVIMLSANSNPEEVQSMTAKGLVSYVTKTQKPTVILESARQLLKLEPKPASKT